MKPPLALLALAACTRPHDVETRYPAAPPVPTGAIEVRLNQPSSALTVTVDDRIVVDRARSRRALVTDVPAGRATVHVATGGRCEQARDTAVAVDVVPGQVATVALPGPEATTGCQIAGGLTLVSFALIGVEAAIVEVALALRHPRVGWR
jgi:hypothetical protein